MLAEQPDRLVRIVRAADVDRGDAEDVAQDVVVRALRAVTGVTGPAEEALLCGWVATIATNTARNYRRSLARRPRPDPFDDHVPEPIDDTDPGDDLVTTAAVTVLHELVERLPAGQRTVFVARVVDERSSAAVAAELGISEGLVRWRLHRARERLRAELDAR